MKKIIWITLLNFTIFLFYSCNKSETKSPDSKESTTLKNKKIFKTNLFLNDKSIIFNLYDDKGLKHGPWTYEIAGNPGILYYKHGKKDGLYIGYDYSRQDSIYIFDIFGEYKNDKRVGTWYICGEQGQIVFKEKILGSNNEYYTTMYNGKKILLPFKSYWIEFYNNGYIKKEGIVVYDDFPVKDCIEVGEWKFYDSTGVYIKTEIQDGKWHP